ncbi:MAG: hypothetical protein V1824_04295 [archaeon]
MISSYQKKIIVWIVGLILSAIVYFLIQSLYTLSYVKSVFWLSIVIPAILLILFFIIGILISKVPDTFYLATSQLKQIDTKKLEDIIDKEKEEDDFKKFVSNIKSTISFFVKNNYPQEALSSFAKGIGITEKQANNLVKILRKQEAAKMFLWVFGFVFSIGIYFTINKFEVLQFLKTPNNLLALVISLVIFILFLIEGFLIARIPDSIYLNLLDINKKQILKHKELIRSRENEIINIKQTKTQSIEKLKQTVRYLLKLNVDKNWIKEYLIKNISENEASKLIEEVFKENIVSKQSSEDHKIIDATIKLSLAKIQENFNELKKVYEKLSTLQKEVDLIKKEAMEIANITKQDFTKEFNLKKNKTSVATQKLTSSKNSTSKLNKTSASFKTNNTKQLTKEINLPKTKDNINLLIDDGLSNQDYRNEIDFLYNLILPQINKISKEELTSMLLIKNYAPHVVDDLLAKFEENNISFKGQITKKSNKFVDFINNLYSKLKK